MHRPQEAVLIRLGCYHQAPEGRRQPDSSQSTFLSPGAETVRWRLELEINVVEMRQHPKNFAKGWNMLIPVGAAQQAPAGRSRRSQGGGKSLPEHALFSR